MEHIIYAGNATSDDTLTAYDTITLEALDAAILKAREMGLTGLELAIHPDAGVPADIPPGVSVRYRDGWVRPNASQ